MLRLWKALINSFNGLGWALRHEEAVQQEAIALALGVPASFFVAVNVAWWLALVGSLTMLMVVELLNTAVEKLSDHVTPEHSQAIKVVKDLGSAAVLLTLLLAGVIWVAGLAARF
jgi:diacylglycerol kinase (ATP)